jgi:hypothetical protein
MDRLAPSQTAYAVARMRAGHQILDAGKIFSDPFACAILFKTAMVDGFVAGEHAIGTAIKAALSAPTQQCYDAPSNVYWTISVHIRLMTISSARLEKR